MDFVYKLIVVFMFKYVFDADVISPVNPTWYLLLVIFSYLLLNKEPPFSALATFFANVTKKKTSTRKNSTKK